MPPSALDRQCPSFLFLLEAELMGGVGVCENWPTSATFPVADQPPLRSGGRFFIKPRARKESYFRLALGLVYSFSLSILRLTHRYLDRSSELHFIFNTDMSQHRSS